jgi:hypothetical protein
MGRGGTLALMIARKPLVVIVTLMNILQQAGRQRYDNWGMDC